MLTSFKRINIADLYIAIWLAEYMISVIEPNAISGSLMILNVLVSFYLFIRTIHLCKYSVFLKGLTVLTLFFSIYGIIHILFGETYFVDETSVEISTVNYIKNIYASFLPIYAFLYFSVKGHLTEAKIRFWSIIFIIAAIVQYYFTYFGVAVTRTNVYAITNNGGYIILALFPLISVWSHKRLFQMIFSIFIVFLCLISAKRGAILISVICFLFYVYSILKNINIRKNIRLVLLCLLGIIIIGHIIVILLEEYDYLYQRLLQTLDGNSNHRDSLASFFLNYYANEPDFLNQMFGCGAEYTIAIAENFAHNDWIEILINNGLVGVLVYLNYWISLLKEFRQSKNYPKIHLGLGLICIILFFKTLFSMSYDSYKIYTTIVIGYFISELIKLKKKEMPY